MKENERPISRIFFHISSQQRRTLLATDACQRRVCGKELAGHIRRSTTGIDEHVQRDQALASDRAMPAHYQVVTSEVSELWF